MRLAHLDIETNTVISIDENATEYPTDENAYFVRLKPTERVEIGAQWSTEGWVSGYSTDPTYLKLSQFEFLKAFTASERITIRSANDPIIIDALDMFRAANNVVLAYPDTQNFINYLALQGHITTERAEEILSGGWIEAVKAEIL